MIVTQVAHLLRERGVAGMELRAEAYRARALYGTDVAIEILLTLLGAPPDAQRFSPRR